MMKTQGSPCQKLKRRKPVNPRKLWNLHCKDPLSATCQRYDCVTSREF
jgi:hypothetical protein